MDNVGYDLSWITVTPDGTSVYLTAVYANSMFSFDRNTETGALSGKCLTKSYMSTTDLIARNLAMSPDSKHMYTGNTNHGIVKFDRQANTPWPSTTEKKWPSFFGDKGEPMNQYVVQNHTDYPIMCHQAATQTTRRLQFHLILHPQQIRHHPIFEISIAALLSLSSLWCCFAFFFLVCFQSFIYIGKKIKH